MAVPYLANALPTLFWAAGPAQVTLLELSGDFGRIRVNLDADAPAVDAAYLGHGDAPPPLLRSSKTLLRPCSPQNKGGGGGGVL